MNRTRANHGFLLVEILTGIAILCGVILLMVFALSRAQEASVQCAERAAAATWLSEVLDGVRAGAIAVRRGGETQIAAAEGLALRGGQCVVRVEPWRDDPALAQVTVAVTWKAAAGNASLRASTLVRDARLKAAGGAP